MTVLIIEKAFHVNPILHTLLKQRYGADLDLVEITQAEFNKDQIVQAIQLADVVAAETQLIDGSEFLLLDLLDLFYQLESKEIFLTGHNISDSLNSLLRRHSKTNINPYDPILVDDPLNKFDLLCSKLYHHKVIDGTKHSEMEWIRHNAMAHKNWEKRRSVYLNNLQSKKTEMQIVLKDLSSAPNWVSSAAKTGDVLFVYDLKEIDPNPARKNAVWTVIDDRPIKLLAERPYKEFSLIG